MRGKHPLIKTPATQEIVGVLLECGPRRVLLSNGTSIRLGKGVSASHIPVGRSVTITCRVSHGVKVAEAIRVNPDWLLEAAAELEREAQRMTKSRTA